VAVSAYVMIFSDLGTLPLGLSGLATVDLAAVRPVTWMWVVYIVVFPTIVAYFLNIWALKRVSPNLVAVYIYLQPLFTALVAPAVLAGERVTTRAAIAGVRSSWSALVILGDRGSNARYREPCRGVGGARALRQRLTQGRRREEFQLPFDPGFRVG
jgi:drug/metabolite transporter (DMT)-like permease